MKQPVLVIPAAMNALQALNKSIHGKGVPDKTLELVKLRASQINGCSACLDMHAYGTKNHNGETDERLYGVAAWRESPFFTDAERAALALTEAVTRIADAREEAVSDAVWQEVTRHYDEQAVAALLLGIASINVWNRLNVATRQIANPALRNYKPEV
jgi:AhpD family alkylhydroperoxidase